MSENYFSQKDTSQLIQKNQKTKKKPKKQKTQTQQQQKKSQTVICMKCGTEFLRFQNFMSNYEK